MESIYNEAYKEWQSESLSDPKNPLTEPAVGDEAKCDEFFARCDAICTLETQTANEYVPSWVSQSACRANEHMRIFKISFACWAGMQVIQKIQLATMPDKFKIVPTVTSGRLVRAAVIPG
jgi:hypothetical protein